MRYFLTVDIGGTDIKYGVINENEELMFKSSTPTQAHIGGPKIIETIIECFNALSKDYKLEGIAISSTGVFDENTQNTAPSVTINNFDDINFRDSLKELNVPITVENDVNSMALCENDLIPNHENMRCTLAMTIGTGIGGAIFINDELHRGISFTAGEWGKITICNRSYEELASTSSLVSAAKMLDSNIKNGIDVFKLYDKGDKKIIGVVNTFYENLATGLANLIYILNPEHIVIGGGITNRGEKFLEELEAVLRPKLWDNLNAKLSLSIAKHKNDAGMIGAFKLYKKTFLSK